LSTAQLAQVKGAVSVGVAPVTPGMPAQLAAQIEQVSHSVFASGMSAGFVVGSIVAVVGAAVGLLARGGSQESGGHAHAGI
jgi:hypothetical protein